MRSRTLALALCVLVVTGSVLALGGCKADAELPPIAAVPSFEMVDQDGKPQSAELLRGHVGIVSFMFTNCPDVCPILTTKLAGLRDKLVPQRAHVRFVSISVDPGNDTPAALKRFAAEHAADHPDWRFLTGPSELVRKVVIEGFKQSIEEQPGEAGKPANILHGSHFVLVDRAAQIRGYYASDEEGMQKLVRDARRLVAERAAVPPKS